MLPSNPSPPWLSIIGIGVDGVESLTPRSRLAIETAQLVIGSERQLRSVQPLLRKESVVWPSPLAAGIDMVLARRGSSTCVLSTGDPFHYGIGSTLAPYLVSGEFVCHPAPSSISIAASRLGWPLQDTDVVSLHGRSLEGMNRFLHPGRKVIALSWDQRTPAELSDLLVRRGFGPSTLYVLESLGGRDERVRSCTADAFRFDDVVDLNLVALKLAAEPGASIVPLCNGLPDAAFENDGQLTKQDMRAITLSALCPRPGLRLWDVGAGAGSIAIEWMLSHPSCRAIAIEKDHSRCERIRRNAASLGVPVMDVVETLAPEGLEDLAPPDAIFMGGGAGTPGNFEACWRALPTGGRLVINAVSLETEALVLAWYGDLGGELRRVSIDAAAPLGSMKGWRSAMPVLSWRAVKP
jgi:precorrin-6Y C5,15-methyltransferase (decarboxylating)